MFIKWFIIFLSILVGSYYAQTFGIFSLIIEADSSYLSLLIFGLFLVGSLNVGFLAWKYDKNSNVLEIRRQSEVPVFIADQLTTLGLLGTIIGFCIMTNSALTDTNVEIIVKTLKQGVSVALFTTLVGLIGSLLLNLQLFVLDYFQTR